MSGRLSALRRAGSLLYVETSTYRDNRVAFAHDCIDWTRVRPRGSSTVAGPTEYQDEINAALDEHDRVLVRGPHGLGKTFTDSLAVLHFALTSDMEATDWKNPTVASSWRQLTKYLWPEIRKWARLIRWDVVGREPFTARELLLLNLRLQYGEAFAVATTDAAAIEGAHADRIFYLFDESKTIAPETWDAAEGAFSGAGESTGLEAKALATSTPGDPAGRFYEIASRKPGYEDWHPIHITLDRAIAAGTIAPEWAEQRAKQWGRKSPTYLNRVEGEFAESGTHAVLNLRDVERAMARWEEWEELGYLPDFTNVGVDVARSGDDRTVLARRYGAYEVQVLADLLVYEQQDTMATTNLIDPITRNAGTWSTVDVIGIGAGVVDRLRELGRDVVPFNASERTDRRDKAGILGFLNMRAFAYWHLRELLEEDSGVDVALVPDDELLGELTAPTWKAAAGGKIQIEAKDDVTARLGRSPDKADAVAMAFLPDRPPTLGIGAMVGTRPSGGHTDDLWTANF